MLQINYLKLSELKLHPKNPRIIKNDQFNRLCESLKSNPELFEARPIIYSDRTGENIIIAGNMRYKAAKHIGLKEVPSVLMPNLTENKEKEIMVRDNISNGEFDWEMLANEWDGNLLFEWGVDIDNLQELDINDNVNFEENCEKCSECGRKLKKSRSSKKRD